MFSKYLTHVTHLSTSVVRGVKVQYFSASDWNINLGQEKTVFFLSFPSPRYCSLYRRHALYFCHVQFYLTRIILHCSSSIIITVRRLRLDLAVPRHFACAACLGYTLYVKKVYQCYF